MPRRGGTLRGHGLPTIGVSALKPQALDIALGRGTEQAAVLAAELRGTLVADHERRARGVVSLIQHQPPRFVQAQPLLVLKGAHRSQLTKVMMQAR